jgi:hypothetical protein
MSHVTITTEQKNDDNVIYWSYNVTLLDGIKKSMGRQYSSDNYCLTKKISVTRSIYEKVEKFLDHTVEHGKFYNDFEKERIPLIGKCIINDSINENEWFCSSHAADVLKIIGLIKESEESTSFTPEMIYLRLLESDVPTSHKVNCVNNTSSRFINNIYDDDND